MASINRYTRPAQATIKKTQVLPDVGFMTGQVQRMQQQYDLNSQGLQVTQGELSKLQGVGEYASNYIKGVDDRFKVLSNELLTKDLGDARVAKQVRDEIYAIKNDPELNKHIAAKQAYDKFSKDLAELSKEGSIPAGNLWEYNKAWNHYSKTGEFDPRLSNPVIIKGVDRLKEGSDLFKNIKASGGESLASIGSEWGNLYYENGWKGISRSKINQTVIDNLDMMMSSKLGQELTREFNMMKELKQAPARSAAEYVYNTLIGIGKTFEYQETSTNASTALNTLRTENRQDAKEKQKESQLVLESESFKSTKYGDIEFDDKGNLVGSGKSVGELWKDSKGVMDFVDKVFNNNTLNKDDLAKAEVQRVIIGAKLNGVTPKQYYDATNKDRTVEFRAFGKNSDAEDLSKRLLDGNTGLLANLQVIDREGKKTSAVRALAKELDLDDDATLQDVSKALSNTSSKVKAVGYANPNEHTKFGVMLSVNGHNMIADLAPYVHRNFKPEEQVKMELEYAAARADAGIPSKIQIPEGNKMVTKYLYKDINTGRITPLSEEEFKQRTK